MESKTVYKKNGHEVVLSECYKIIEGKIKTLVIEETGQYFSCTKRANRAAGDLLLKKSLTKFRYQEKKEEKRKKFGAAKIQNTYKCYLDAEIFIKRWENIIYLETKKRLRTELKEKVSDLCEKFQFDGPKAAIAFLERGNKK